MKIWEAGISDQQRTNWNIVLGVPQKQKRKWSRREMGFQEISWLPILVYSPASLLNSCPVRVPNPEDLWSPSSAIPNVYASLSQRLPLTMWSHRASEPHTYTEADIHTGLGIYLELSLPEHPGVCAKLGVSALLGLQALPVARKAACISPWTQTRSSQPCMLLTRGLQQSGCGLSSNWNWLTAAVRWNQAGEKRVSEKLT
jgi:hypothetical protein